MTYRELSRYVNLIVGLCIHNNQMYIWRAADKLIFKKYGCSYRLLYNYFRVAERVRIPVPYIRSHIYRNEELMV